MLHDSIVKISFESDATANNAARTALTGGITPSYSRPFTHVGTGSYSAQSVGGSDLADAMTRLAKVLDTHSSSIDSVSIQIVKRD